MKWLAGVALIGVGLATSLPTHAQKNHENGPSEKKSAPNCSPKDEVAKREFMLHYVKAPPEERVRIWRVCVQRGSFTVETRRYSEGKLDASETPRVLGIFRGYDFFRMKMRTFATAEMRSYSIMEGVDAAPFLAATVRAPINNKARGVWKAVQWAHFLSGLPLLMGPLPDASQDIRPEALRLLVEMDRFVPEENLVLPAAHNNLLRVGGSGRRGGISRFAPVDGHRIGKEAFETVQWAAQQTEDPGLQFAARWATGQLREDLRKLPVPELITLWREALRKVNRSSTWFGYDPFSGGVSTQQILEEILIERATETLPHLAEVVERDPKRDGWAAHGMIRRIDECRLRLRGTEAGQRAIQALRTHIATTIKKGHRERYANTVMGQILQDEVGLVPNAFTLDGIGSRWAFYAFALQSLYGVSTTKDYDPQQVGEAKPEVREFITHLTERDPFFLSWEYVSCGDRVADEVFHPGFKTRMERYHQQWLQFQAQKQGPSPPPGLEKK